MSPEISPEMKSEIGENGILLKVRISNEAVPEKHRKSFAWNGKKALRNF